MPEWVDDFPRLAERGVGVSKVAMNRLVMNYFVTEGYVDAAQAFQEESGTEPGVDLETITDRMAVRQAVQRGDMESAIDRVNDLNPEILEHQRELYFHLQQQRLVEKIRAGDTSEALVFAQEYLAPLGEDNPAFLEDLERTVALLAFDEDNVGASPFADLLSPAQRNRTAGELNAALLASQCQERDSRLPVLLRMLVRAQDRLRERVKFPAMDVSELEGGTCPTSSHACPATRTPLRGTRVAPRVPRRVMKRSPSACDFFLVEGACKGAPI